MDMYMTVWSVYDIKAGTKDLMEVIVCAKMENF